MFSRAHTHECLRACLAVCAWFEKALSNVSCMRDPPGDKRTGRLVDERVTCKLN